MDIPCSNPGVQCESQFGTPNDPFLPEGNFSSEAPDAVRYFRTNYGSWRFPPLGSRWYSPTCWGMASSTISQADADAQAMNANTLCLSPQWPQRQPNPSAPDPGQPPYYYPDRQVFGNRFQMCFYTCPDGSVASFGVRAGYILGFSQAGADARAYSFACRQVSRSRMCLSNLSATYGCTGSDFEALIVSSTRFAPVQFSVSSGTLPPGLALAVTGDRTATISGIPATAGTYVFGVTATDAAGVTITRQYTLKVVGISTQLLPAAVLGSPYSATLMHEGPMEGLILWAVSGGVLPDGLTLDEFTGEISGTPTVEGDFGFSVTVEDDNAICEKNFSILVEQQCVNIFDEIEWGAPTYLDAASTGDGDVAGTSSASVAGSDFTMGATSNAVPGGTLGHIRFSQGKVIVSGSFDYQGPEMQCGFSGQMEGTPSGGVDEEYAWGVEFRAKVEYDGGVIIEDSVIGTDSGSFFFPFTIPESVEQKNVVVTLTALADSTTLGAAGADATEMSVSGRISSCTGCPDWDSVTWGAPTQGESGGGTVSSVSASGGAASGSVEVIPTGTAFVQLLGSLTYNGSGCSCKASFSWDASQHTDPFNNAGYVFGYFAVVGAVSGDAIYTEFDTYIDGAAAGSDEIQFNMPNTNGDDEAFSVEFYVFSTALFFNPCNIAASVTFSNT